MEDKLVERREKAENIFNELVKLKEYVSAKLKDYNVSDYDEIETELARLQGEFRLVEDLLVESAVKIKTSPPSANVIDAEPVAKPKAAK